ncbi:MAG: hypothetical protein L0322_26655, partial [Chloroflexi bacterium]|nr:hypothetical protein [Chloroflexota bacterium]
VVPQEALARHLALNPGLAHHLATAGRRLVGDDLLGQPTPPDPAETAARLAAHALDASAALAPSLLEPEEAQAATLALRRLAGRLSGQPVTERAPAGELFAAVQAHLAAYLAGRVAEEPAPAGLVDGAPPLLPDLQAIYEVGETVVLVLPDLPPERLRQVAWPEVAELVAGDYRGLRVTTTGQLRLILQHDRPAEHFFRNYQHAWGLEVLAGLDVPLWRVLRDLARQPSELQTAVLPQAYFTAGDDQLSMLIHDFGNKLLNIQLQQELLSRMAGRRRTMPPEPIPDRSFPSAVRIDAIFDHFNWWADHYAAGIGPAQES